jgi:hypothetical protein
MGRLILLGLIGCRVSDAVRRCMMLLEGAGSSLDVGTSHQRNALHARMVIQGGLYEAIDRACLPTTEKPSAGC